MVKVSGIDLGNSTIKVLHLDYEKNGWEIAGKGIYEIGNARISKILVEAYNDMLSRHGLKASDITYVAATGAGREIVDFADRKFSDVTSHAFGACHLFRRIEPDAIVGSVLDVGAQYARAMTISDKGVVLQFRFNDKCAGGSGRFLENVADALEVELDDIGEMSNRSIQTIKVSSVCAVYAETEIINLKTAGYPVKDILKAVHNSIAERLVSLLVQINAQPVLAVTGGVSKNIGVIRSLEERLVAHGVKMEVCFDYENSVYAGALGAALLGGYRHHHRKLK